MLKLFRQPYYRWLADPVTVVELAEAYRANALFDARQDDPEFGCRFQVDAAMDAEEVMRERSAWRICRDNRWWPAMAAQKHTRSSRRATAGRPGDGPAAVGPDPLLFLDDAHGTPHPVGVATTG